MILEAVSSNKKSLILIDFIGVSALLPTHICTFLYICAKCESLNHFLGAAAVAVLLLIFFYYNYLFKINIAFYFSENVVRLKVNVYLSFYVFNQSIQNWTIGNGQMFISNTMWPVLLSYLHYWLACKSSYFQCKIINFGNKVVLYL